MIDDYTCICIGGEYDGLHIPTTKRFYEGEKVSLPDPRPITYDLDGLAPANHSFYNYIFQRIEVNRMFFNCFVAPSTSGRLVELRILEYSEKLPIKNPYQFIQEYGLEIANNVVNGALYGLTIKRQGIYELAIAGLKQAIADFELLKPNKLPNDGWYGPEDKYGLNGAELYLSMYSPYMAQDEILALQQVIQRVRENINE
ncbi:hypothetical protein [Acinetobacter modestus]|uniref:hypothetical protein n=1 Tax=Acinetobacter modestus TaxID=1776740 RepID=UPI00301A45F1